MTNDPKYMPELLPCPFCGEALTFDQHDRWTHAEHDMPCYLDGAAVIEAPISWQRWNRRPDRGPQIDVDDVAGKIMERVQMELQTNLMDTFDQPLGDYVCKHIVRILTEAQGGQSDGF